MTEPPSGFTYKDQALSIQELQARRDASPRQPPTNTEETPQEPHSGITYKDQALTLQHLLVRGAGVSQQQPPPAMDGDIPLIVTRDCHS